MRRSRNVRLRVFCLVVVCGLAGACGSAADDREGTGGPVSLNALPDRAADAYCDPLLRCCSSEERSVLAGSSPVLNYSSKESCESSYSGVIEGFTLPDLREATNTGRAAYDPEAMGSCLEKAQSRGCGAFPEESGESFQSCDDAIAPKVPLGGRCGRSFECKKGSCVKSNPDAEFGTCTELAGEGKSCADTRCRERLHCDMQTETCESPESQGASSAEGGECESGVCAENPSGDRVCQPEKSKGESCARGDQCESGLCKGASPDSDGTCLAAPACTGS